MAVVVSANYTATGTNYSYQTADGDRVSGFRPIGQGVEEHDHTTTRGLGPQDDRVFSFGNTRDLAHVHRTAVLGANTALANVVIGTPVVTAMPADTHIVSHITASGDIAWLMNDGSGNSWEWLRFDSSANLFVINEAANDIDFRIEGDTNANMFVIDANTDAFSHGAAVVAGAFGTIDGSTANRAGVTSVGRELHMPAATFTQTNANPTTLAVGARTFFGIPTLAGSNAGQTITNAATVYIAGAPVAGTNMTLSNTYSLLVVGAAAFNDAVTLGNAAADNITITGTVQGTTLFASGAALSFNSADVTITHSANALAFAGATSGYRFDDSTAVGGTAATTAWLRLAGTGKEVGLAISPTLQPGENTDSFAIELAPTLTEFGSGTHNFFSGINIAMVITAGAGSVDNAAAVNIAAFAAASGTTTASGLRIAVPTGGTNNWAINVVSGNVALPSGGVLNWNAGDVTLTHSANVLALAGGTLDMSNNAISNIGAAGTDFSATGGLTLADTLTVTTGGLTVTAGTTTLGAFTDITAGGLRVKGSATAPSADTANTDCIFNLSAGSNAGALDNVVEIRYYRTNSLSARIGMYADATVGTIGGVAYDNLDLAIDVGGTFRAFFDNSDSGRLVLGGGLSVQGATAMNIRGATSGTITAHAPATVTTWDWTFPPTDGNAGEQLQTDGSGVSTWEAAASYRGAKNLLGLLAPEVALGRILAAPIHRFRYRPEARGVGGDYETEFVGVIAEEAPWAMKHNGRILSEINVAGHAFAAIQAHEARIAALEAR